MRVRPPAAIAAAITVATVVVTVVTAAAAGADDTPSPSQSPSNSASGPAVTTSSGTSASSVPSGRSQSAGAAATRSTATKLATISATAGKAVTVSATVSPAPTAGTVAFADGSRTVCSAAGVKSGRATCSMTFAAGSHTVTARYSGKSGTYAASSTSQKVQVAAVAASTFVGSLGSCTTTTGALVAVNFAKWGGPVVRGCDPSPTTGIKLLTTAGFTTAGDQHDGPQFICRIGHSLFNSGTQYPTAAEDKCVVTPPASAYWSYWLAAKGSNTWTYSQYGAYSDKPTNGEVEAWTFGGTDVAGTYGQPPFTPNQVRAGLPTGAAQAAPHVQRRATPAIAGDTPDLTIGANYLVNGADPTTNTKYLVDGHYYDPYGIGFADWGLTIDGVYALAAAGNRDADLRRIMAFLDAGGQDASGRTVNDWTGVGTDYPAGGSIGKLALAAIVTGYDPRDFGGHDLIKALDDTVCTAAIENECAAPGNFRFSPSTFAQVLPIIAMLRAGDATGAAKPVAYLESLQHADGSFPSVLPGEDSETDSTGMAAMALALVPGTTARTQLAKALSWLASRQESTGGFPGASGDSVNSAAIVVQALRLDAQTYATQIAKAQKFLATEQNTDGGFNVAVGAEANGSDLRASTQALGGAVGTPFGSVLDNLAAKDAAATGATYLISQLTDGNHYEADGFANQGQTADAVFALLAAGGHAQTVQAMTSWLEGQVDAYTDPTGAQGGPYSGGLAKLALIAEATGNDPHDFGGVDLLTLIRSKVCTAAIAGDFSPCTAPGDVYNAFSGVSQALAVLALQASPDAADHLTATSPIVVRLHQLQCADGGFASVLVTAGQQCTSEVDTTGFAVQALAAVPGTDTWLGAAQANLQKQQRSTGLFGGAAGDNSNSTALAADALQSLVDALTSATADPPQPKTIAPIAAWQSALSGLTSLSVAGGGFRITPGSTGADLRASTQAVQAAAQRSLLALSGATVQSLPRVPATVAPPGGNPTTRPTPSGPAPSGGGTNGSGAGNSTSGLAFTGANVGGQVRWAMALLVMGALVLLASRRRPSAVRHRARHR